MSGALHRNEIAAEPRVPLRYVVRGRRGGGDKSPPYDGVDLGCRERIYPFRIAWQGQIEMPAARRDGIEKGGWAPF